MNRAQSLHAVVLVPFAILAACAGTLSTGIFKTRAARGAIGLHDSRTLQPPQ